jgi:hypothetical protein
LQKQQPRLDPKRLVFIDETSVSTTITRLYGRAPQGERLVQKVPHGNWKTVTFIAALRHDRVTAPFVLEGPMTGEMFKAYTEQFLAPTLKRGDIVFMDNVSVHKVYNLDLRDPAGYFLASKFEIRNKDVIYVLKRPVEALSRTVSAKSADCRLVQESDPTS